MGRATWSPIPVALSVRCHVCQDMSHWEGIHMCRIAYFGGGDCHSDETEAICGISWRRVGVPSRASDGLCPVESDHCRSSAQRKISAA